MHLYGQDLAWDCYTSFEKICTRVMALYLCQNFVLRSISRGPIGRISPNFIYAFIFARSRLGLLHIIFGKIFTRVMALDLLRNFVSAVYLETYLTYFHHI